MEYKAKKAVPQGLRRRIRKALSPRCLGDVLGEDEAISVTVGFPDGVEMDIKCCGVRTEEGRPLSDSAAWTEAVLFNAKGSELCFTEPSDGFFGQWELQNGGVSYVAEVL